MRYICKTCGAESPAGIGYAANEQTEFPAPDPACAGPHATGPRCAECFEAVVGEGSANMGIEGVSFAPGTCGTCGHVGTVFTAACHAARTGQGYWTCDQPGGCDDCRALAAEIGDDDAFDDPEQGPRLSARDGSMNAYFTGNAL